MTVGIVLVTFECREFALACLASIERHLPGQLAQTVVVDNASRDGTVAAIRNAYPAVLVLEQGRNAGFAAAANIGMRALPAAHTICLLNPDAELLDSALLEAAAFLEADRTIGVAGLRIENADGTLQASCRAFPGHRTALFNRHSLATRFLPGNRWSRQYLMTGWSHDQVRDVDWVSGACMLIHRRAIDAVGGLDPGYFFSIEDVDYCRRVHDAGLRVVYYPGARVRHLVGKSSRHNAYRAMAAHHRGMWRYYRKYLRGNVVVDAATAAGIAARLGIHAAAYTIRTGLTRIRERSQRRTSR